MVAALLLVADRVPKYAAREVSSGAVANWSIQPPGLIFHTSNREQERANPLLQEQCSLLKKRLMVKVGKQHGSGRSGSSRIATRIRKHSGLEWSLKRRPKSVSTGRGFQEPVSYLPRDHLCDGARAADGPRGREPGPRVMASRRSDSSLRARWLARNSSAHPRMGTMVPRRVELSPRPFRNNR